MFLCEIYIRSFIRSNSVVRPNTIGMLINIHQASYWKTGEKQPSPVENNNQASYNISGDAGENFEQNPIGMKPGIIIRNLR